MGLLIKMSWRNIWRNRKRTLITSAALVLALTLMIIYTGITQGVSRHLQESVTRLTYGDFQIHHKRYLEELSLYDTVQQVDALLQGLAGQGIAAAPRWYGYGLLANDRSMKSAGVEVAGVDLLREPHVTELHLPEMLRQGRYLSGKTETIAGAGDAENPLTVEEVVLGKKVAETLGARLGDLLVLVTTASDGSLGNEMFRVVGILKNVGETFDRTRVLMSREAYQRLFSFDPQAAHEIVLRDRGGLGVAEVRRLVRPLLRGSDELKHWTELVPLVADVVAVVGVVTTILMLIIYMSAGLVILNSILMMVFERLREFGIMKALGYQPLQIIALVLTETFFMTLLAVICGIASGALLNDYLVRHGLDLSRFAPNGYDFSGTTIDPVLRSIPDGYIFLRPVVLLMLITLVSAIYPAVKAARAQPIKAIHRR